MQLLNQQRYKIIISDEPEVVSRGISGLFIPVISSNEGGETTISDNEIEDAINYVRHFLDIEREWSDDSQNSETESEDEDDDYDWTPPPSPIHLEVDDEFEDDSIDEIELQELIAVLDNIVRTNPNLLNDPRPVIDVDIYKYGSLVSGSDELVWEFEYSIREDTTNANTGD